MKLLFGTREILTNDQLDLYKEEGFLLVSGLIRRDTVERAHRIVLARLDNAQPGTRHEFMDHPLVLSCFSREVRSAAAQLIGPGSSVKPPRTVYAISILSTPPPWQWPAPHIDHAIEKDAYRTFPPPFRVGCMIYLNQVSPHMGGTIIWPGSHRQIEDLAASDPLKYEFLSVLYRDIGKLNLRSPVEITAAAGDVLFYHRLCGHAGSRNVGGEPRVALNYKW